MQLLHEIQASTTAYIWAYLMGANGRPVGDGVHHAFLGRRGEPPPLDPDYPANHWRNATRQHWGPWTNPLRHMTRDELLNPVCGQIRSRSLHPRAYLSHSGITTWRLCDTCNQLAHPQFVQNLNRADPWTIRHRENFEWGVLRAGGDPAWHMQPDPISGL